METGKQITSNQAKTALTVQMVLIILAFFACAYNLVFAPEGADARTQMPVYIFLFGIAAMFVYSTWGYKKTIIPFHLAAEAILVSAVLIIERGRAGILQLPTLRMVVLCLTVAAAEVFDCSAKKYKKVSLVSGAALVLMTFVLGVITITDNVASGIGAAAIITDHPFTLFCIASALYITYVVRVLWSRAGKPDAIFGDEE